MSTLYTFPGQGAQRPGILHALPDCPATIATLAQASSVLGKDSLTLDSALALQSTIAVQLCLLIAGVATARALQDLGQGPQMVAGLSIGAYPAAVVAGALDFADALRLTALRGELMETAYPQGYGMTAISGLYQQALEKLIAQVNCPDQPVYLANLNAPTQLVIAGSVAAMQAVSELARTQGAQQCVRLDVAVPSHCPLLAGPAQTLAAAFRDIPLRRPRLTYLSSSRARPILNGAAIADDLAGNMACQVHWHDTLRLAWERGARLAVEMPSGNVLTRLAAPIFADGGVAVSVAQCDLASIVVLMANADK